MGLRTRAWAWVTDQIKTLLPRGRFARSVAVLAGGTVLGQAITVLASPILTRLYTPDDFGVLAVYTSILGILSVIASLRYELAIPLPEKDEDAANLLMLSIGIVLLMSLLIGLGTWFLGEPIVQLTDAPALRPYLWLLPVGVLLVGTYQVFNYWAVRRRAFGLIARTKLHQGLGAVFTQIGFGLIKPLPLGLLLGQVVGQAAGVFTLIGVLGKQGRDLLKAVKLPGASGVSRRYYRFPLYVSWSGVLNTLSVQIPILILSSLFGSAMTGFYMLASRILWIPTQLISQATSQVLLSAGSEAARQGNVSYLVASAFKRLVLIGLPCFSLIGLIAPEGAVLIFGQNWQEAGVLMQWLTPWIFLVFVTSPLSAFSIVLEKQRQEAFFQSILLTSRVGALLVGWVLGSPHAAVGLFSAISAICWLGYLIWILSLTGVPVVKVGAKSVLQEVRANLALFLPLVLVKMFSSDKNWLLVGSLATFSLIAVRIVFRLRAGGISDV